MALHWKYKRRMVGDGVLLHRDHHDGSNER